jgi:hypothetical protein
LDRVRPFGRREVGSAFDRVLIEVDHQAVGAAGAPVMPIDYLIYQEPPCAGSPLL